MRVHLNCAASLDGRLAADGNPVRLSDDADMVRVHRLRGELDAILVGSGTVLADDPSLRVNPEYADGADPLRVVLDGRGRIPPGARVLDGSAPTLVLHGPHVQRDWGTAGDAVVPLKSGRMPLADVLRAIEETGAASVLVEGGAEVLASFLKAGAWDTWTLFQAPKILGGTGPCLPATDAPIRLTDAQPGAGGVLWTFSPGT